MKAKLNFNAKAIRGFLLAHGEKFGFGLIAILMLLFISGAMNRSGYEMSPEKLKEIAGRKNGEIDNRPPPAAEERFTPWVKEYALEIRDPVDAKRYRYDILWTPFIWPQPAQRSQPLLYTVRDLRGAAGHGALRVRPNPLNPATLSGLMGQRWVVITGLIPYEEQYKAYLEAFGKAEYQDPQRDVPQVVYYRVERAEVQSQGQAGQVQWTAINLRVRLNAIYDLWNGSLSELVNPTKYIHQDGPDPIAFPLPPIETGAFGREIAHDPEIPLAAEELAEEARTAAEAMLTPPAATDAPEMIDMPIGAGPQVIEQVVVEETMVPYRLYRFFDFDVEPGKYYQYRVKLVLNNPNYGVERRYLAQDDLRDAQFLETPWSEPSEPIGVTRDARVLVGPVKPSPGGRVTSEPRAMVGIPYFLFDSGIEIYERYEVPRGKYLNFPNRPLPEGVAPVVPGSPGGAGWLAAATAASANPADPNKPVVPTVNFYTESVVLDMIGGERLSGRDRDLTLPGSVLLLDPGGNLVVQDELDDKAEYDRFQPPEEPKSRRDQEKEKRPLTSDEDSSEEDYEEE